MARHIALLRGINLASRNRVPMGELREALGEAGFEDVATLLQSGNVVVTSGKAPRTVEREIAALVEDRFGVRAAVVVRSATELEAVIEGNPFSAEAAKAPKNVHVIFLSAKPEAAAVRQLTDADLGDERVAPDGKHIYAWFANGVQRSPLARMLTDERLGVTATGRNWNTVLKLQALAERD
jgi:uncharacterized protein (DUF1697 family)